MMYRHWTARTSWYYACIIKTHIATMWSSKTSQTRVALWLSDGYFVYKVLVNVEDA